MIRRCIFTLALITFCAVPQTTQAATNVTIESGIEWLGSAFADKLGYSLSSAGDVNNDGFEDLLVGKPYYDNGASNDVGRVYLLYGKSTAFALADLNAAVTFTGATAADYIGWSTAGVGDVNNDGFSDFVIGGTQVGSNGGAYLIYGQSTTLSSITLSSATAVEFLGESGTNVKGEAGSAVAAAGDVNNDGFSDFLIGSQTQGTTLNSYGSGAVYLMYGQAAPLADQNLSTAIKFSGEDDYDGVGTSITAADLNNDNYTDIIIGACQCIHSGFEPGLAYIQYGSSSPLTSRNVSTMVQLTGESDYDRAGYSVSTIGDFNTDGYEDVAIGAPKHVNVDGGSANGSVYLIYGKSDQYTNGALATNPILKGTRSYGNAGYTLFGGRDANGDAIPDLLIGEPINAGSAGGDVQVVYGSRHSASTTTIPSIANIYLQSSANHGNTMGSAMAMGDWDGDGYDDMIIGAPNYGPEEATFSIGATYLIYQRLDVDRDSVLGTTNNRLFSGSDCNDNDSAVSTNQTYYQDADNDGAGSGSSTSVCSAVAPTGYRTSVSGATDCDDTNSTVSSNQTYYTDGDGDGLGSDTTTRVCSATAPSGHVTNSNDTNDTIVNNGIEIHGDGIDNDDDGTVDEINTLSTNGSHPAYRNLSLTSTDAYNTAIQSVSAQQHGVIRVTFTDNSIYDYSLFTTNTTKNTHYTIIAGTGRVIAISENGRQLKLINLFTGATLDSVTGITKTKRTFTSHGVFLFDLRGDHTKEIIAISRDKKQTTFVSVVSISASNTLTVRSRKELNKTPAVIGKTTFKKSSIELKNSKKKLLHRLQVSKRYGLTVF